MSHEEQLEIEESAEIVDKPLLPGVSPDIMAPSAGLSFQLSPARSSAFSTPSRSPSRHSSGGGDDLDDDMPSAVFSSFSQSPGDTASNPTTPDRKSRISTTITVSPKCGSSPGLSETGTHPNPSTPEKTSITPKHSPDRSATVIFPSLTSTPDRSTDESLQGQTGASDTSVASGGRAVVSGGASLRNETKATVTPNHSPNRDAIDQSAQVQPKIPDETSEAKATVTSTASADREVIDQADPAQLKTPDETRVAGATHVRTPERNAPSGSTSEQSAPEKDTFVRSKTDPNYTLHQIATGTSSEHLTPERIHYSKPPEENNADAAVPAPPPEDATPRVSNQEQRSMSAAGSAAGSVVESVSSGMQQAFLSLRTYMKVETVSNQGSGVLDTSLDKSLTDFDIQELVKEIREVNKNEEEKKGQNEMEGGEKESPPQTSKKTVTLPRTADDIVAPLPHHDGLPSRSPAAVAARSRSRKERMVRVNGNTYSRATPSPPAEAPTKKDASGSAHSTTPITPPRASIRSDGAMTPIMRMRTTGSPETPVLEKSPHRLSDEEVKASKQRKWKDKLKLAEKQKEQERRELDGRGRRKEGEGEKEGRRRRKKTSKEGRKKTTKKKTATLKKKREDDADTSYMQCHDGISKLMETVMRGRCGALNGALNDTFSIFDESDADDDSFESGSESASEEYDLVEKGTSTDEGESEDESETGRDGNLGVRFEAEAHVAEKDAASGSNRLPPRTIGRISLHEEASEDPNDVGIHDKNFIHSFITSATTRGTVLFLHKKSRRQSFTQPSKMTAFLKLGSEEVDGTFGGPQFVWVAYDGIQAGRIDLFDIRAVDKATPLQLQHYPLAMPGRSLVIKMNRSPDCVFEAMDEEAALRFVHGMRWVVARLAFNLIIGNMDVSCELLDIGRHEDNKQKTRIPPQSPVEEAQWGMAMNSLTNHLVDKASLFTTQ